MAINLTLTIDENLLREARKIALDKNTSVNQMVRDFLDKLVQESAAQQRALVQLDEFFDAKPFRVGKRTWSRDDLHER